MRPTFRLLLLIAGLLLLACNHSHEKMISRYYESEPDSNFDLEIRVYDSLELDVPATLAGFDSVSVYFPASRKEFSYSRKDSMQYRSTYYFGIRNLIPVFDKNDSVQVVFKKKGRIVFRPVLHRYSDTITTGGSGMVKLC